MRISNLLIVSLVFISAPIFADGAADEDAVWKLEEAYWEYVKNNDMDGYRSLWDENFIGWPGFSKSPLGKENIADWIGPLHADASLAYHYELTKGAVRSFGDIVVVHYLVRDSLHSSETGEETNVALDRITHTWQRRGDSWQIVTGMSASWIGQDYSERHSVTVQSIGKQNDR